MIDAIATAGSPQEALEQVLHVLDVQPAADRAEPTEPTEPTESTEEGVDFFAGTSYRPPWGRIFGGQVLAQSLVAAGRTVDEARPVHSLHGYFLRPGDPGEPISFVVERLRDGRSFSARRTQALQRGKPILSMISSFQLPGTGLDHQTPMPDVPGPDDVLSLEDRFGNVDIPAVQQMLRSRPVDLRHVEGPVYDEPGPEKVAHQAVWMRPAGPMPDDPRAHTALLTFASDYSLLESILRRHGLVDAGHALGQPRPRDVVPPPVPLRRLGAVRAGEPVGLRRARPGHGPPLHAGRRAGRLDGPGGHDPAAPGVSTGVSTGVTRRHCRYDGRHWPCRADARAVAQP